MKKATRKYRPGRRVKTMASLSKHIDAGRWLYLYDKVMHPAWLGSTTYHTLRILVRGGRVRLAVENQKKESQE